MYKRVEKREKKKAEEEKLGLDSEMKEVLGMHDTDSDESDSDSNSSSSSSSSSSDASSSANGADEPSAPKGVKRKRSAEAEAEEEDDSEEEESEDEEDSSEDEEGVADPVAAMSLQDALANPVYLVSAASEVKACLLCPGRELRNEKMVEVHQKSGGHIRRLRRFKGLAEKADPATNPRQLLKDNVNTPTKSEAESQRAIKRKERLDKIKVKREARAEKKAKQKAKLAAKEAERAEKGLPPSKATGGRKSKKQKVDNVAEKVTKPKIKTSGPPNRKQQRYFADEPNHHAPAPAIDGSESHKAGKYGRAGQAKRKLASQESAYREGLKIFD